MTKSAFLNTALIVFAALFILMFTITDFFVAGNDDDLNLSKAGTKSDSAAFAGAFIARNPPHGQPGHRHDLPDGAPLPHTANTAPMPAMNALSLTGTSALPPTINSTLPEATGPVNPPHGQPGHRCDLAVGAPLTGAPQAAAAPAPNPALNPAHGQPGHRCDIAVGAPLNSAPAKAPVTTSATTVASTTSTTAKNINPPHGQPGHRCDIAVGAPLTSAPTATTPAPTPIDPSKLYPFPTIGDSTKTPADTVK